MWWNFQFFSTFLGFLVVSLSTAKSNNVTWLSEPDAANTELSEGCHLTDVMGAVWCLNTATATPLRTETI